MDERRDIRNIDAVLAEMDHGFDEPATAYSTRVLIRAVRALVAENLDLRVRVEALESGMARMPPNDPYRIIDGECSALSYLIRGGWVGKVFGRWYRPDDPSKDYGMDEAVEVQREADRLKRADAGPPGEGPSGRAGGSMRPA